jgi:hypothetical protein
VAVLHGDDAPVYFSGVDDFRRYTRRLAADSRDDE